MDYDLIVIGGGPAGYTGAIRAAKLGQKVALIEENELGGTCLNRGCIPTKALLHSSEIFKGKADWQSLGIMADNVSFSQDLCYKRKDTIVSNLRKGVQSLIAANKIDLFTARGRIKDKNSVSVGDKTLTAKFILIASGSRPSARAIEGIENALNSDDLLAKPFEGDSIIIIGAGVIAIEFASYLAGIGKNVTILAQSERIIKVMSQDLSNQLASVLKRGGIKIVTNAKIVSVGTNCVSFESGGKTSELTADGVLAAIGRRANIEDLGLENVGLASDKYISVDSSCKTSIDNIYACGDCTGGIQLAHYAAASAITAVESMLNMPHSIDLSVVPSCIYTSPEIATVGKKEEEVENAVTGKFPMAANGKQSIEGINRGYIKVIADSSEVLVGAEAFCVRASDIIGELSLAISKKMTLKEVAKVIHAHPTIYEAIAEACEDAHGLSTHKV